MKIIETKSISNLIGKYFCITIDKYNIDQIEHKLKINGLRLIWDLLVSFIRKIFLKLERTL